MIRITEEMRQMVNNALANKTPCVIATASPDGRPDVGVKGSMMVFNDDSLAYWERSKRQALKNLQENPRVMVLFRDGKTNWRFEGAATIHSAGTIRDQVLARVVPAELEKDPERKGFAVVIRVDRVVTLAGEVLQTR